MWEEDPAITIYRELPQYGRNHGYAGPYNRQSSEVLAKYIIVDLFAKAVRGRLDPERHRVGGTGIEGHLRGVTCRGARRVRTLRAHLPRLLPPDDHPEPPMHLTAQEKTRY